ncbi:heme ABC exporter ATP-binding protein CcmA [Ensifer soli]|uniref:heme ABC exporter ATP-binding protein CcmA n=1 Tax=Ciceribacter sp. sgz301302 TaxID=3342379 RepID=UPI0035BA911B
MRLTVEGLSAERGGDLIFKDISFELGPGDALLVTGANGSGKSTLLRVLAGLLPPLAGRVEITGEGIETTAGSCHYLGHRNAMKRELTVDENLSFWTSFMGDFPGGRGRPVADAIAAFGLTGVGHLPFGYLSAGQQRRIAMAKLLVAHRPVWLLDEPTAALDAASEAGFSRLIEDHRAGGGIVVAATHQPLGLAGTKSLRMTGFSGADGEDAE